MWIPDTTGIDLSSKAFRREAQIRHEMEFIFIVVHLNDPFSIFRELHKSGILNLETLPSQH